MLKFILASLDGVDAALHGFYEKKDDGKFYLKVEGAKTQADIDRQLQANQAERTAHNETKNKLKEATDKLALLGEGVDPTEIATKLEKLATYEAAEQPDIVKNFQKVVDAEVTKRVDSRLKTETQKLERQVATLTQERDTFKTSAESLTGQIQASTIGAAIKNAGIAAKVMPEAIDTLVALASTRKFKLESDNRVVDDQGIDPTQWVEDLKKSHQFLWPVAKGAGGQGNNGNDIVKDNPFSHDGWNMTKQGQLVNANRSEADRLAKLAGTTVGGPRPVPAKAA